MSFNVRKQLKTQISGSTPRSIILTSSKNRVFPGETITFTLTTTNQSDGTVFPYSITGLYISGVKFGSFSSSLNGQFTVINNTASISLILLRSERCRQSNFSDAIFTVTCAGESLSLIYDRSTCINFEYSDVSMYTGDSLNVYITSNNDSNGVRSAIPDGYLCKWAVKYGDIKNVGSITQETGEFTIINNTAQITLAALEKYTSEDIYFYIEYYDRFNNYFSQSPAMHIYNRLPSDYSLMKSTPSVTEGGSVTITLNTINIPNFINVPYTVTGVSSDDINGASLKGNFYINNNTASVTFNIKSDTLNEYTEILTLSLDNGKASVSVNILDNNPTYSLSTNASVQTINNLKYYVVNENQSVTITLNTTNVANYTNVPYNIIGVSSDDINGASLTGNFYINNNTASVTFNIKGDAFTENTEILTLEIPNKAINILIFINDTSKTGCIRTSGNWVITGKVAICESVTVNGNIFISNGATLWIKYPAHLTQPDNFDIHVQEGSGGLYATGTLSGGALYMGSNVNVYLDRPPPDYATFSCADIC